MVEASGDRVFGVFNKRTYTVAALCADLRAISWTTAGGVWLRGTLDRQTREAITLAVSHAHDCRYCTFIHREWALHTGLPLSVITQIEAGSGPRLQQESESPHDRRWLATTYAEALARAEFGPVSPVLDAAVTLEFSAVERRRIETVARVLTVLNRSTNTFDALLARRRGAPVEGSRLPDEVVVSLFGWAVVFPMFAAVALLRRERPREILARFRRTGQD